MAGLLDIKRRIASVKSTQKITRAMKMVAAAKLRRAQSAILRARPYAWRMGELVNRLALRADLGSHPLLRGNGTGEGKVGIIVVSGDRGLCGAFNSNMVNATMNALRHQFAGRTVELTVVGRRGADMLRRRQAAIRAVHTGVLEDDLDHAAHGIIDDIAADFERGGTAEVYCLYNEFKSAIAQKVTLEKILPFEPSDEAAGAVVDYVYEPSEEAVFDALLTRHLEIQMQRILLESAASEYGARMTAMESATKNAGEMIERLTLVYNRARQDAITKELIEVVSGSEAL